MICSVCFCGAFIWVECDLLSWFYLIWHRAKVQWEWHITYTKQLSTCILILNDVTCIPSVVLIILIWWQLFWANSTLWNNKYFRVQFVFNWALKIDKTGSICTNTHQAFVQPNGCVLNLCRLLPLQLNIYVYILNYILFMFRNPHLNCLLEQFKRLFAPHPSQQCHVNWLRNYSRWIAIELCEITIIVMLSYDYRVLRSK